MNSLILPLLAIAAGCAITLQAQFMGLMDQTLGSKASIVITYAGGGLVAALFALGSGGIQLKTPHHLPWYVFTAGLLGLVVVGTTGYVIPRMGAARGFTVIIAAQFLLAALIDQLGLFNAPLRPLALPQILGILVMLSGVWLVVR
ncbi:MAG: DMT family transporter [Cyanobacteria bacterium P01_G01_bin.54]